MAHGMSVKSEFVDHICMYDLESYDTCKVLGVKNEKLRKRPLCYIELAKSDQHRLFIITLNLTF